ncbi:MAG: tetratricopeptide repeat protein [Chromatiales bacterium]|nr:tetratricopeptide repeat protein [Chromatiales bacterium]
MHRDSNDASPWYNLGNLLQLHLARYEEAEAAYRQAIALDSNDASPWNNLGILLQHHLARYEEAEATYRQAIALDSNTPRPGITWAYCCNTTSPATRKPRPLTAKRLHWIPMTPSPWNNLGILLQDHLARYEEAEAAYQRALDLGLTPKNPQANLLFPYYTQPERSEAESLFDNLVERLPSPDAILLRAFRALAMDNFGEATQALAMALAGNSAALLMNYGVLRVLRLAAARGYGDKLLAWLDEQGYTDHYWPLRAAFDAYLHGEAKLMDVNLKQRGAAKRIYDWLASACRAQTAMTEESAKASRSKRKGSARRSR